MGICSRNIREVSNPDTDEHLYSIATNRFYTRTHETRAHIGVLALPNGQYWPIKEWKDRGGSPLLGWAARGRGLSEFRPKRRVNQHYSSENLLPAHALPLIMGDRIPENSPKYCPYPLLSR